MSEWGDVRPSLHCGRDPHVESFKEWQDEGIEPVDEQLENQELGPE